MHHVRTALVLALLAAGCSKPNDLGRLQEEAATVPARYQPQIAVLEQRADVAQKSSMLVGPSATPVVKLLNGARGRLAQLDGMAAQLATELKNPQTAQSPLALHALIDKTELDYVLGLREANTSLTSVEAWIDRAHAGSGAPVTPPAAGVPDGSPSPGPGQAGSGAPTGSTP